MNPFNASGLFLFPLETSENQRFFDVCSGFGKKPVPWNGLTITWFYETRKKEIPECAKMKFMTGLNEITFRAFTIYLF